MFILSFMKKCSKCGYLWMKKTEKEIVNKDGDVENALM